MIIKSIRSLFFTCIIMVTCTNTLISQLLISIHSLPPNTPDTARIFISGNFNGWNPADNDYELIKDPEGIFKLLLKPEISVLEYKFTLGSWEKVECALNGEDIQNRRTIFKNGDSIRVKIDAWKSGSIKHTASSNVFILKDDFYIPQLNRKRRIWIYLPPDYYSTTHSYPVFYAHDGQNLFDAASSFSGEWGIDECLDSLYKIKGKSSIIVGIDNGGVYRTEELTPWPNHKYGGGKGSLYADFIVYTLKPFIDSAYRTLPDRKNTGVFGSSLGGLISFYMALQYPKIFGKAGVFSPSFWYSEKVYEMAMNTKLHKQLKLFIIAGRKEDENLENEVMRMKKILESKGFNNKNSVVKIIPDGEHHEWFWKREFPQVYNWLNN